MMDESQLLMLTEGNAQAAFVQLTDQGQRLPDLPARFVKLSNFDVIDDLVTNNTAVIFWGFHTNIAHQLFPGDTSLLIPVTNCQQIFARTKPGETVKLFFSYYK